MRNDRVLIPEVSSIMGVLAGYGIKFPPILDAYKFVFVCW